MNVTRRQISFRRGTIGGHDPYGWETVRVFINDDVVEFTSCSLRGHKLEVNDNVIFDWTEHSRNIQLMEEAFKLKTGMSIDSVHHYHEKWLDRNPEIREMMEIDNMIRSWM